MSSVKNLEKGDIMGISKIVNEEKDKDEQCSSSPKDQKRTECRRWMQWLFFLFFKERGSGFSLGFRPIGPSVLDGARSKVTLRGEGYAWTLIWWSSDNSKR